MNLFSLIPHIAYAQADTNLSIKQLVFRVSEKILNPLIGLGLTVTVVYFLWTIFKYVRDRNNGAVWDSENKDKGTSGNDILWGIVGLAIFVSAFAIMRLLKSIIGSDVIVP